MSCHVSPYVLGLLNLDCAFLSAKMTLWLLPGPEPAHHFPLDNGEQFIGKSTQRLMRRTNFALAIRQKPITNKWNPPSI
jgi:hypothetical protein